MTQAIEQLILREAGERAGLCAHVPPRQAGGQQAGCARQGAPDSARWFAYQEHDRPGGDRPMNADSTLKSKISSAVSVYIGWIIVGVIIGVIFSGIYNWGYRAGQVQMRDTLLCLNAKVAGETLALEAARYCNRLGYRVQSIATPIKDQTDERD